LEQLGDKLGNIFYLLGFPKNEVLLRLLEPTMEISRQNHAVWQTKAVRFTSFRYRARHWPCSRSIVAKADFSAQGANPRFVLTNIEGFPAEMLYNAYCERGECENRIKDLKNALAADRLSCSRFEANFFRLLLHLVAYRLMHALRSAIAPISFELGRAQFDTIRLKLLKVGALVTESARRILVRLPQSFPLQSPSCRSRSASISTPRPPNQHLSDCRRIEHPADPRLGAPSAQPAGFNRPVRAPCTLRPVTSVDAEGRFPPHRSRRTGPRLRRSRPSPHAHE
jgi:hypothetical protein